MTQDLFPLACLRCGSRWFGLKSKGQVHCLQCGGIVVSIESDAGDVVFIPLNELGVEVIGKRTDKQ